MSKEQRETIPYTLGLDIGIASVGAALLVEDHILALHVRTFDRAETADKGESLNKARRDARSVRRRLRRRAHRLERLRKLFQKKGLVKSATPDAFVSSNASPWELRARGLEEKLSELNWAAVLYHIVKHRGFQSNRKSEVKDDEKVGQMLSGVKGNQKLLKENGFRTVGELAARHGEFAEAKRNKGGEYKRTFERKDLEDELRQLFAKQRECGNTHADENFEQAVHELLMARRPTLSGNDLLDMVGKCTFEKDEYRAPRATYTAQRFVWVQKLSNLRIGTFGHRKKDSRSLSGDEYALLLNKPFENAKLTFKQVRKMLDLGDDDFFIGLSYPTGGKQDKDPETAALYEAKSHHALRKAYKGNGLKLEWARDSQNPERLDIIAYALTVYKEDDSVREYLREHGIEENIIEVVLEVSFSTFLHLSLKALRNLLPLMEQGKTYVEAAAKVYNHHSQTTGNEKSRYIPRLSQDDIRNPVVHRALNQARKLVNAIVREYGSPNAVHIELARDLSNSYDERRKIQKGQDEYRDIKERDKNDFMEKFGHEPKGLELMKWQLYREQDSKCSYSQKPIALNRLCEAGYVEVDHALPYSRSYDNSKNNKVLVLTKENRDKGNRTPYEYLDGESNSEEWCKFEVAVLANKKIRKAKQRKLLRKDFGKDVASEFRERHLTDTRYICKYFKNMVESYLQLRDDSERRCVVISGALTGHLRARWGLIKVRADGDLHHALDAAVVAACSWSMVKRLSDYSRRDELEYARGECIDYETGEIIDLQKLEKEFPKPWPLFRQELLARLSDEPTDILSRLEDYPKAWAEDVKAVRVSRAPTRRRSGAAHQDTIRSAKWLDEKKSMVKKPLTKLKLKDIAMIVGHDDPRNTQLIKAIEARLKAHGDDGKKAFAEPLYKPSAASKQSPRVRSVKIFETQKSGICVRGGIAANGDMVRTDVFTDGKRFYVVPVYVSDMVKKKLPDKAVVTNKPENEWIPMEAEKGYSFMFSLYPNDWVKVQAQNKPTKEGYFAGMDRTTGAIHLWCHDRDRSVGKDGLQRSIGIKTAVSVEKYHVNLLGQLYKVWKEKCTHPGKFN